MKLYEIRYLNLNKVLLFPWNQTICLKNWKLWGAPSATKFNLFCWDFAHVSYLRMSTKGCSGYFLFCLDLELLKKNVKNECVETRSFLTFANNSRSKPNKKNPKHLFVEMISTKGVRSVSQKYWTLWYLERIKVFTFSDKKPGFSKIIELCLNFYLGFRIT